MSIPAEIAQRLNDEVVGAVILIEIDSSEGFVRLYPGEAGVFESADSKRWIGCTLLRMGAVKLSSNGAAPTWEASLSYVHDPDRTDLLEVIRNYGVAAINGRKCNLYFQYFGKTEEMYAPIWTPILLRSVTMRRLVYNIVGPSERSVTLICEGPFPLRSKPLNGRYSDADQRRRYPGDPSLEFMPTHGFDDQPLFGL
ncbi:hypothetical protein [Devosia sp. MC1541]|uniref:hypothetical protein n=1 Tax=Devosia sp. MC1541 TaxID=2725264 RepID=UPI00145D649E|nr:hypothetical protein [Devosia sp. MC1541]